MNISLIRLTTAKSEKKRKNCFFFQPIFSHFSHHPAAVRATINFLLRSVQYFIFIFASYGHYQNCQSCGCWGIRRFFCQTFFGWNFELFKFSAGKTALLTCFLDNTFETDPLTTIGIDFKHKIVQLNDGQVGETILRLRYGVAERKQSVAEFSQKKIEKASSIVKLKFEFEFHL